MEIRSLCYCACTDTKTIQLGGRTSSLDRSFRVTGRRSRLRSLWKKLMKEKRKMKIFDCSAAQAAQVHVPGYDPYTYAQNFDQGLMWDDEPDNLARSFSMRFAAPSTRFVSGRFLHRSISDVGHDNQHVICVVF